jgi:hypothetical protein
MAQPVPEDACIVFLAAVIPTINSGRFRMPDGYIRREKCNWIPLALRGGHTADVASIPGSALSMPVDRSVLNAVGVLPSL